MHEWVRIWILDSYSARDIRPCFCANNFNLISLCVKGHLDMLQLQPPTHSSPGKALFSGSSLPPGSLGTLCTHVHCVHAPFSVGHLDTYWGHPKCNIPNVALKTMNMAIEITSVLGDISFQWRKNTRNKYSDYLNLRLKVKITQIIHWNKASQGNVCFLLY